MSFATVTLLSDDSTGGQDQRDLNINQDSITFCVQPPFKAVLCQTRDTQMTIKNCDALTLPKFEMADGGILWVGKKVIFWHETDTIGFYILALPGQAQFVVKSSRAALEAALGPVMEPPSKIIL